MADEAECTGEGKGVYYERKKITWTNKHTLLLI